MYETHTQGTLNFSKFLHITVQSLRTGKLKTPRHNVPTLRNFKYLKVFTTHTPHHTGKLWHFENISKSPAQGPHTGELWKIFKVSTHHRAHTQGNFENFQSPHTAQGPHTGELVKIIKVPTQHRAHTQGNFWKLSKSPHSTELTQREACENY